MHNNILKRIFDFLEEKGEHNAPIEWKLINNIPLTKEELNVKGVLDLRFSSITSLPEGLEVGDDLYLHYSKITSLPKGLIVRGNLYLSSSNITLLPKGLKVGRNIYLSETLKNYKAWEIRDMVKPGGYINGTIKR